MEKNFWKIILAVAVVIRIIYIFIIPPGQLPDEKFDFKRILTNISDPASILFPDKEEFFYNNNEYCYPPLYFLISSTIVKTAGVNLSFNQLVPILRFVSLILSVLSLIFIWKILDIAIPNNLIKLTSYIFIAFLPTLAGFSIAANPNNLAFFLVTLFMYFTVRNYNKKASYLSGFVAGSVFGLAILTKPDALVVLPFLLYPLYNLRKQKKSLFIYLSTFLTASIVFGGWWYLANCYKTGFFYNQKLFEAAISESIIPFSFKYYITVLIYNTFASFYATFGSINNIYLNPLLYTPIYLLSLMSLLGLTTKFSSLLDMTKNKFQFYLPFLLSFILNLSFFCIMNFYFSYQAQGRYLFNSVIFISLVWAYGLFYFLPQKIHKIVLFIIFIFFISLNLLSFRCNFQSFYGIKLFPETFKCL